jgi:hypothetical protein
MSPTPEEKDTDIKHEDMNSSVDDVIINSNYDDMMEYFSHMRGHDPSIDIVVEAMITITETGGENISPETRETLLSLNKILHSFAPEENYLPLVNNFITTFNEVISARIQSNPHITQQAVYAYITARTTLLNYVTTL